MIVQFIRQVTVAIFLILVPALPVWADYEAGQQAWDEGRPAEALEEWQGAADDGDRRAMLALGRLHEMGIGAPQNYVLAHMWFNLAASRGEMDAVAARDALAAKMTPQQVAEAQERASQWRPGGGAAPDTQEAAAAPAAPAAEDPGPPPAEALREAQALLAALGYDPGPADGVWGRRSVEAYQAFLRDAGLPPADVLTPNALHAMRAIAERQGGAPAAATGDEAPQVAAAAPAQPALPPDALHRAVKAGNIDGLKAALEAGADVDARDGQGWTALMHAANKGYTLLVPALLEAEADPDIRAPDGATALFMAAVHGHSEVIAHLMKAEADISIRGPKGKRASDVARVRYGDLDAAKQSGEGEAVLALLQGQTLAEAQDDAAFAKAKSSGTAAAYEAYRKAYPAGRHAAEARRWIVVEQEKAAKAAARAQYVDKGWSRKAVVGALSRARKAAKKINAPYYRGHALTSIAEVQALIGNLRAANNLISAARKIPRKLDEYNLLLGAIISAQASVGSFKDAFKNIKGFTETIKGLTVTDWSGRDDALAAISRAQADAGQFRAALATVEHIDVDSPGRKVRKVDALVGIAGVQARNGKSRDAEKTISRALAAANKHHKPYVGIQNLLNISALQKDLGDDSGFERTLSKALAAANDKSNPLSHNYQAIIYAEMAIAQANRGNQSTAEKLFSRALAEARRDDHEDSRSAAWHSREAMARIAVWRAEVGKYDDALSLAAEVKEGELSLRVDVYAAIAIVQMESGDMDGATKSLAMAEDTLPFVEPGYEIGALVYIAYAQAKMGNDASALTILNEISSGSRYVDILTYIAADRYNARKTLCMTADKRIRESTNCAGF